MRPASRLAFAVIGGAAVLVILGGTAYVVAADSGELGPVPAAYVTPSPAP